VVLALIIDLEPLCGTLDFQKPFPDAKISSAAAGPQGSNR
jgi:hypothetical protein